VLLVSHDRAFVNNVVTSTLVFEGGGQCQRIVAGTTTGCDSGPWNQTGYNQQNSPHWSGLPDQGQIGFRQQKELDTVTLDIQSLETEQEDLYKAWVIQSLQKTKILAKRFVKVKIEEKTEKL